MARDLVALGASVRAHRTLRGLTRTQLVERLVSNAAPTTHNATLQEVDNLEAGEATHPKLLERVARALDLDRDQLDLWYVSAGQLPPDLYAAIAKCPAKWGDVRKLLGR